MLKRIVSLLAVLALLACLMPALADDDLELQPWMGLTPQELAASLPDPIIEDDSVSTADYGVMAMADTAFGSINYMLISAEGYTFAGISCGMSLEQVTALLSAMNARTDDSEYASDGCLSAATDSLTFSLYFTDGVLTNLCVMTD